LYRCETWSLTLREEHRLRVFENRVLRKTFGPRKDEATESGEDYITRSFMISSSSNSLISQATPGDLIGLSEQDVQGLAILSRFRFVVSYFPRPCRSGPSIAFCFAWHLWCHASSSSDVRIMCPKYFNLTIPLWLDSLIWAWASSFRRGFTVTH
jgi:hypothetical protein